MEPWRGAGRSPAKFFGCFVHQFQRILAISLSYNEHMGAPHHYTGPGGAILPVEGVDTHLTVGWTRLRRPILPSSGERRGSPCIATPCTPIGVLVVAARGMSSLVPPNDSTGPGGAVVPVEGVDTHLTVGWIRLRCPILRRLAGVAVHRATVDTDRCTGRGCM